MKQVFIFCTLLLSGTTNYAQVSTGFENATGQDLQGSLEGGCLYLDTDNTSVHLLENYTNPYCGLITVQETGAGSTLGYQITFDPNGSNGTIGFTDGDAFGVANNTSLSFQVGANAPEGVQAFLMEDTDGEVSMAFDQVDLTGAVNPSISLQYILASTDWEAADILYVHVEITDCAGATSVVLIDTRTSDIERMGIEGAWTTLSANLSAYTDCIAQLFIEHSSDGSAEEAAFDDIQFTAGTLVAVTPVKFLSFEGKPENNSIHLQWLTTSEENNDFFEIQHSADGRAFIPIGKINGSGTTSELQRYDFTHLTPAPGQHYYRLKQVDYDGTFACSTIESVFFDQISSSTATITPNPFQDQLQLHWNINSSGTTPGNNITVDIFDVYGKRLRSIPLEATALQATLDLSSLLSGTYFLHIREQGNDFKPLRIVKI
jgi:hypothetical protein